MAEFQGSFASMFAALRGYVTTRNRNFRGEYEANLAINEFAWEALNRRLDTLTPEQQTTLTTIEENRNVFLELPQQMFEILEGEQFREDLYLFRTEIIPLTEKMETLLKDLTADQQSSLERELNISRADLARSNQQTLILGIAALLVGVGLAFVFRGLSLHYMSRYNLVYFL
ncbi:MAG: adenylate class-3/4/guanylyl cyclase, partial [Chloroflexota bacterium]